MSNTMEEMNYVEKFAKLDEWLNYVIEDVKKDLRNEHLKKDWGFVKKYFSGKNVSKLTVEELTDGYRSAFSKEEKPEELAEFITNRWLFKNGDIYKFFEEKLSQINPNFQEIKEIEKDQSERILQEAYAQFNPVQVYLFSVLNSVAFSPMVFDSMHHSAKKAVLHQKNEAEEQKKRQSQEEMIHLYEQKIARLTDKYEKRLEGIQKKYHIDVAALKKQNAALQRKLSEK